MSQSKRNNARVLKSNDFMVWARKCRLDKQARIRRINKMKGAGK